jgi:drug/metabolite transporter (DMT)-like permease
VNPINRGILLFIASLFVATCVDAPAKYLLHQGVPLNTVVFFRYLIALLALISFFAARREKPQRSQSIPANLLRGVLLTSSTFANFYAISKLPLALVVSINFAAPLMSCAMVPFILKEHVGPRRWAAVIVGFIGVLVILRPGSTSFHPAMFACLFNAFLIALFQIITRKVGFKDDPQTGLLWVFSVGLIASAIALPNGWQMPSANLFPIAIFMGCSGLVTHYLSSQALRLAPASLIAPFQYTQLIWMTLSGIIMFGDWPDHYTLIGAAIIIGSGIYVWHRERVRAVPATV